METNLIHGVWALSRTDELHRPPKPPPPQPLSQPTPKISVIAPNEATTTLRAFYASGSHPRAPGRCCPSCGFCCRRRPGSCLQVFEAASPYADNTITPRGLSAFPSRQRKQCLMPLFSVVILFLLWYHAMCSNTYFLVKTWKPWIVCSISDNL